MIGGSRLVGSIGLGLVVLATAAWALVVSDARVEQHPGLVVIAIGRVRRRHRRRAACDSHDLWSYVMYGRAVSVHHASPYVHVPSDFAHDPFLEHVAAGWRHARSVYGPAFTGVSAVLTRLTGNSVLRTRLAFQALAAISVVAALSLIWRATRSVRAVAFLGLHPAVVMSIVNGGHNDMLVGLAILAGGMLATRRRWSGAGVVLGLGILVKASAGLGLLALAAWSARRDRRGAVRLVIAAAMTTAAGDAPAGIAGVRAVAHAGNGNTHVSVWDPISSLLHPTTTMMLAVVLICVVLVAFRSSRAAARQQSTLATMAVYLIGGVYILPWYPSWALPTATLERRSPVAILVAAHAAFLVAVYEYELPAHPTLTGAWAVVRSVTLQAGASAGTRRAGRAADRSARWARSRRAARRRCRRPPRRARGVVAEHSCVRDWRGRRAGRRRRHRRKRGTSRPTQRPSASRCATAARR